MTKIQKITLFFMLILMLSLYGFWIKENNTKPIEIKTIKIEALNIKKEEPSDILSKLKIATNVSKEGMVIPKEEMSNKVLRSLKNKIAQQEIKEVLITEKSPIIKKSIVTKEIVPKKEPKSKLASKSKLTSKTSNTKPKRNNVPKNKSITINKKIVENEPSKKQELLIPELQAVQKNKTAKRLSREQEVALYNHQYANTLEVVNVSDNFEIKEENILPDSHYFEPIKKLKTVVKNAPLEFVEKLGVVTVSDKYESSFAIPKKVEVAKEGIVNFSHTSVETKELEKLKFVDTLGILEVSEDFETLDAQKYLN